MGPFLGPTTMSGDRLQIFLLGRFALRRDGIEVDRLRTRKTEGLLAWLALNRGASFPRTSLLERFWPDEDEAAGRRKLRLALHSIRQEVGEALVTERDHVSLIESWVDALDEDGLGGEILPDFDFDWLPAARADHALRRESRLRDRLEVQRAAGEAEAAKETLYALLESDPYEPRWYRLLHQNLLKLGRRGEARALAGIARARLGPDCPAGLAEEASGIGGPRRTFVGRSRILASLIELLLADREPVAAVLVGPGGIGKTRIGQEAMAYAKREGISAFFVRLLDRVTKEEVRDAVLTGLGEKAETFDIRALPPTLLVLDNCEQCAPEALRWLASLLTEGSSLRMLATSQRPFEELLGETFVVPALSLVSNPNLDAVLRSEACQLFALEAEIDIDAETAPRIAAICRRMGGIPLAVRHAAARLSETTLEELAANIETFERGQSRARREGDARHRTVADCVQWSLALLDPPLRTQLAKLAYFSDGFRPASAEALGVEAADLQRLIRLNWVSKRSGEDTFELLPPFRALLRHHLSEESRPELRRRFTHYLARRIAADVRERYASLVDFLGLHLREMQEAFEVELEASRLDHAEAMFTGLYHVKLQRGDLAGAREDARRFTDAIPAGEETRYPNAWNLYGSAAYFQRDFDRAEACFAIAAQGEDPHFRGVGQTNLGLIATRRREYEQAIPLLEAAAATPGLPARSRAARRLNLAECLLAVGRSREAEAIALDELAALSEDPEVRTMRGLMQLLLAEIAFWEGQEDAARDWVDRALVFFVAEGQRIRVAEAHALLACLVPRERLGEILQALLAVDDGLDSTLLGFGLGLYRQGEHAAAEPFLAAIDWREAPVWVTLRFGNLEPKGPERSGLRHATREEWRLRAEGIVKRL